MQIENVRASEYTCQNYIISDFNLGWIWPDSSSIPGYFIPTVPSPPTSQADAENPSFYRWMGGTTQETTVKVSHVTQTPTV